MFPHNFLPIETDSQETVICRSLAAFIIIFILQTQQKLIDQPDLIPVSVVQKPHPLSHPPLGFWWDDCDISKIPPFFFFFISNRLGRLNLLNPQHGTHIKTRSGLAETGFLCHTRTHTPTPTNLWSGAAGKHGGDWFLLSLRCHQLSASCPGRSSRGPVAPVRGVGG